MSPPLSGDRWVKFGLWLGGRIIRQGRTAAERERIRERLVRDCEADVAGWAERAESIRRLVGSLKRLNVGESGNT